MSRMSMASMDIFDILQYITETIKAFYINSESALLLESNIGDPLKLIWLYTYSYTYSYMTRMSHIPYSS